MSVINLKKNTQVLLLFNYGKRIMPHAINLIPHGVCEISTMRITGPNAVPIKKWRNSAQALFSSFNSRLIPTRMSVYLLNSDFIHIRHHTPKNCTRSNNGFCFVCEVNVEFKLSIRLQKKTPAHAHASFYSKRSRRAHSHTFK